MTRKSPFEQIGASSVVGLRDTMQDVHSIQYSRGDGENYGGRIHLFDGHGRRGHEAALIANDVFLDNLHIPADQLSDVFLEADEAIKAHGYNGSGTTATVVDIAVTAEGERTYTGMWAGDSPAYLVYDRDLPVGEVEYEELTPFLHDTTNSIEVARVKALGVPVENSLFGGLAVSRSLGEHSSVILPTPEVARIQTKGRNLLVVGSDGVLTANTTRTVLAEVLSSDRRHINLQRLAEHIVKLYTGQDGTRDNGTLIIASLREIITTDTLPPLGD